MRTACGIVAALSLWLTADSALAQTSYPEQPIRILVGFTPGVAPDVVGRIMAEKFTEAWGKPVVIENLTGAGGNIATERVAKAPPDGYTLILAGNASLIFSPSLYDKLAFDPIKDFAPISQVFVAANVLAVHPSVPVKSIPELVALAKAQPGALTYAHAGAGTSQHLAAELFKSMAQVDIRPVAYRGTTHLLPDLLAGRVSMSFANVLNVPPLVKEGKLRAFAVTSVKRSVTMPEMPTMIEMGYPGYEAVPWFGFMAPAGTSPAIIDKLHKETVRVLGLPDVRKKLEELGLDVIAGTPAELAAVIAREIPQWGKVIKGAGIKLGK